MTWTKDARRIREVSARYGWGRQWGWQCRVARLLKVSPPTISDIVKGRRRISCELEERVARALAEAGNPCPSCCGVTRREVGEETTVGYLSSPDGHDHNPNTQHVRYTCKSCGETWVVTERAACPVDGCYWGQTDTRVRGDAASPDPA